MDKDLQNEVALIAAAIPGIRDEIEQAADHEDAMPEDVEKVERRVAGIVERFSILMRRLNADDKTVVQKDLGVRIEILKAHVLKLRDT
jgi:hypothetical protein